MSANRRVSLVDLGAKSTVEPVPAAVEAPAPPPTTLAPAPEPTPAPKRPSRRQGSAPVKPAPSPERMRYDEYERKEARLRADQYEALSAASRQLNRTRKGRGERITENTLIRVAIDLLLTRQDDLNGTTEAELRKSVGL